MSRQIAANLRQLIERCPVTGVNEALVLASAGQWLEQIVDGKIVMVSAPQSAQTGDAPMGTNGAHPAAEPAQPQVPG